MTLELSRFTDQNVHAPRVRAAMAKIKHRPNERKHGQPGLPDRITVTLKNGASHTIEVAQRSTLTSKSDIEAKFMGCATLVLSKSRAEQLCERAIKWNNYWTSRR